MAAKGVEKGQAPITRYDQVQLATVEFLFDTSTVRLRFTSEQPQMTTSSKLPVCSEGPVLSSNVIISHGTQSTTQCDQCGR